MLVVGVSGGVAVLKAAAFLDGIAMVTKSVICPGSTRRSEKKP
jgi:hypothetical protein